MIRPTPASADETARALRACLADVEPYSARVLGKPLRRYQIEIARAVWESVRRGLGLTFTVTLARQMGKNELSAHLESFLLTRYQLDGGTIVKAAPTWKPQIVNSKLRLEACLDTWLNRGRWRGEYGYIVRLGNARCMFLSAQPGSSVVGATASLLLEIDEAQDVDPEKYSRDFRPMASTTNATTVLYGTAWGPDSLLARAQEANRALEARDGVRRNFVYDWTVLAALSPAYDRYVRAEIERLGDEHPAVRTQYLLQAIDGEGRFFSPAQLAQMRAAHARERAPREGAAYVAGVDLAGSDEEASDAALRALKPRKDSTVVTIAEVVSAPDPAAGTFLAPTLRVVEHYWWTGRDHLEAARALDDLLFDVWSCRRVVVDASGVGQAVATMLARARGAYRVEAYTFTRPSKSDLAYELLSQVNTGRFKVYADDASPEWREWAEEARLARYALHANQIMDFFVRPEDGHDDFVVSAALCAWAARLWSPGAVSRLRRPRGLYTEEGRY